MGPHALPRQRGAPLPSAFEVSAGRGEEVVGQGRGKGGGSIMSYHLRVETLVGTDLGGGLELAHALEEAIGGEAGRSLGEDEPIAAAEARLEEERGSGAAQRALGHDGDAI